MVSCVHDARDGDQGGAEGGDEYHEALPYFAAIVEDVEFPGEVE